jgi:hypothetical protein
MYYHYLYDIKNLFVFGPGSILPASSRLSFVKSIQPVSPNQKNGSPDSVARNLLFSEIISFGVSSVFVPVWQDKKITKR